mgnify:CR=1 FL=1
MELMQTSQMDSIEEMSGYTDQLEFSGKTGCLSQALSQPLPSQSSHSPANSPPNQPPI